MCIVLQTARENSGKAQQAREILEKLREGLQEYEVQMLSGQKSSGQIILILSVTRDVLLKTPQLDTERMREDMRRKMQRDSRVFGVIGRWEKGYGQIVSLYVQACADLQKVFYLGYHGLITENAGNTSHMQEKQEKYDLKSFGGGSCTKGMEECRAGSREDIFILSGEDGDTSKHCQRCIFPV